MERMEGAVPGGVTGLGVVVDGVVREGIEGVRESMALFVAVERGENVYYFFF